MQEQNNLKRDVKMEIFALPLVVSGICLIIILFLMYKKDKHDMNTIIELQNTEV